MAYIAAVEEVIALYALDVTQRRLTRLGDRGPTAYDKQHTSACRHDLAILGLRSHVIYLAFGLVKIKPNCYFTIPDGLRILETIKELII